MSLKIDLKIFIFIAIFLITNQIELYAIIMIFAFIHELGHFLVAKLCKVKVNEFAIGFGPLIWKKQGRETKYALRLLPLGGFVSMEGEEERSEDSRSFSKASIPKRIAICAAGAIVNIVFGLIVYFILMSVTLGPYVSNEIDTTLNDFVAQEIGLQNGDKVIELDGNKVNSQIDINKVLENQNGEEIDIKIDRNGEILEYNIEPTEVPSKHTGIYLDDDCKIVTVEKGSPAEEQGIKSNDELIAINGEPVNGDTQKVVEIFNTEGLNTMLLTIKRGNEEIKIELTPDYIPNYYLGVTFKKVPDNFINRCINGGMQTSEFMFSIIDNLKQLFTGNVGVDQMMGPVGISETVAKTDDIQDFIYLLALISLSLGVTNLLPIPALDGGKILILLIEAIRRKPLKEQTEINIQLLGFSILIALAIFVTYNDILRIF